MSTLPLVGKDPVFRSAVALARRLAAGRSPILLVGATGTGKSHLARLIHQWGGRSAFPFLEWNAGAVPETLFEAELFGVHRGAATGVEERPGIFESSGRGTLCLSGIEHLLPYQQAALLRIVEQRTFERIGGGGPLRTEARILATFQEPPEALVQRGTLRPDLLYRLDVVRLELPPLARRRGDVALLATHFLKAACRSRRSKVPALSVDLVRALEEHHWPGNLRELAQRMEALALMDEEAVTAEMLPASFWAGPDPVEDALSRRLTLAELKDGYIRAVLARVGGNRSRAARWLGVSRKALWSHLRRTSN